jgi:ribosomal protein L29
MARGWESKSVEQQVAEHQAKGDENKKRQLTPEQLESQRKREVLLLSRSRVQKDLQASQNPRHRDQLNRALADLETQLAALKEKS